MGGIIALIYGLRALPWDRLGGRGLSYVDIEGVPPFRRLELAGQTSTANIALVGLDGRCCRSLLCEDSLGESSGLDVWDEQAASPPLPYHELAHVQPRA